MATRPYAGKSSERLTALINRHNRRKIVHGVDFTFGDVRAVSHPSYNTEVDLIPKSNFYRPQVVRYTRAPLSAYINNGGILLPVDVFYNEFKVHDILAEISAGTGVDFEERDLINSTHSRAGVQTIQIDATRSLAWVSGQLTFQVTNINARLTAAGAVRVTNDGKVMVNNT
jgi:hypothetical protein